MTPFLFGESKRPLFGVMHEPSDTSSRSGVLLCPPIGQEHVRTHWAFRQLALALARAGHHVLRFDWYGVGDSAGQLDGARVDGWLDDADVACQELRDATGVARVAIVGMRLGAALAALSVGRTRPSALVLWEPVWSGARYLAELEGVERALLADTRRYWHRWPVSVRQLVGGVLPSVAQRRMSGADELVGMTMSSGLRADIEAIEATRFVDLGGTPVVVIESGTPADDLVATLRRAGARPAVERTRLEARFDDPEQTEELLLPGDALAAIVGAVDHELSSER